MNHNNLTLKSIFKLIAFVIKYSSISRSLALSLSLSFSLNLSVGEVD